MKPGSKQWKLFMAKLYGFGAAIVIIGALFKIQHWPFAGLMLIIGLSTEALIFIFSSFEPLHEDPDWTLVYPELALGHDDDYDPHAVDHKKKDSGSLTQQLDTMLEDAKIEPELIQSLGVGLKSLSDNANKLGEISSASAASDGFVNSLKSASDRVSKLSEGYERASASLVGLTSTAAEGQSFGEQMMKVSKNLSSLNDVYELQLKGSSNHLQTTTKMYEGMSELMHNLQGSLDDTKKYKETMHELSKNLTALNQVYGNMLNAMTIKK